MVKTHDLMRASILIMALLCTACGEFSYKRGANQSDQENARKSCQSNSQSSSQYTQCMSDNGWLVKNFDEKDPVADVEVTSDNRGDFSKSTAEKEATDGSTNHEAGNSEPTPPKNPNDLFKVSSWWKIGGNEPELKKAMNACVASLGEAHQPNIQTQEVTRAFLICMRQSGWTALRSR